MIGRKEEEVIRGGKEERRIEVRRWMKVTRAIKEGRREKALREKEKGRGGET